MLKSRSKREREGREEVLSWQRVALRRRNEKRRNERNFGVWELPALRLRMNPARPLARSLARPSPSIAPPLPTLHPSSPLLFSSSPLVIVKPFIDGRQRPRPPWPHFCHKREAFRQDGTYHSLVVIFYYIYFFRHNDFDVTPATGSPKKMV